MYSNNINENNEITNYMMSFQDYMDAALFNPKWGYYGAGTVNFEDDFQTYAEEYAPLLAERCFKAWSGMVKEEEISEGEVFRIYEFGAGTGIMASRFMKYVHGMSLRFPDTQWLQFYEVLSYQIAEISPALKDKQTNFLSAYIKLGKVFVHLADARKIGETLPKGAGMVLSNELIDALPAQKIQLNYDKTTEKLTAKILCVMATIPEIILKGMIKGDNCETRLKKYQTDMLAKEKKWGVPQEVQKSLREENRWIFKKCDMNNLLSANPAKYSSYVVMKEWPVNLDFLSGREKSRIESMLEKSASLLKKMMSAEDKSQLIIYLHTAIYDYMQAISSFLTTGYVISLDYGDNAYAYFRGLFNGDLTLRTYSKNERDLQNGAALSNPGQRDITSDVNFSDLDEIGKNYNLQTIFYGTQDELGGAALSQEFKLLIQQFNFPQSRATQCAKYLLEDMKQPAQVSYEAILSLCDRIQEAIAYGRDLYANHSWENLKRLLDWFLEQNHLTTNRACLALTDTALFGPIQSSSNPAGILTNGCFQLLKSYRAIGFFTQNLSKGIVDKLKEQCCFEEFIKHEVYSEIFLNMIEHTLYLQKSPETKEYIELMVYPLNLLKAEIFQQHPHIEERLMNKKQMKDFNFIHFSSAEEKAKSHLSVTLSTAEEALEHSVNYGVHGIPSLLDKSL